jgi:O-antigen/teichoic acid export membrane protein
MIAFSAYRLIATGIGTGLASVLLYHVSRRGEDHGELEVRLHRSALLVGTFLALALCAGGWFGADAIASAFEKPGLGMWLKTMTPFLLFSLLGMVSSGSYEGRSQVATAIFLTEVAPNALRLGLLGALPFLGLTDQWVAHVMAASVSLPWILSVRHIFTRSVRGVQWFSLWDYGYAARLAVFNFASLQVQGIDMVVAGWMFPADAVADYAIASRIAALYPFFLQLRVRMFGPVAGRLLARGDHVALQREVTLAKQFSTILVLFTVAGLLLATPLFLRLFWNSSTLATLLIIFAFAPVYRAHFAAGDRLLQMGGHANWNMGIQLAALAIVVGVPVVAGPSIGVVALPIAMTISGFALNPVIAYGARKLAGVTLLQPQDALSVFGAGVAVVVPMLALKGMVAVLVSGAMFLLLALMLLYLHRDILKGMT